MYILCMILLGMVIIGLISENQRLKKNEKHLKKKAQTDSLTKIYNRASVEYLIDDFLHSQDGKNGVHGLLLVDLDNFKDINDTYGHNAGDQVLVQLSNLLKQKFRKTDIVGRMGGDEFLVFIKSMEDEEQIQAYGTMIINEIEMLKNIRDIKVTASMGICTNCGKNFHQMYLEADKALYQAKEKGKNVCFLYKNEKEGNTINT
ncbi:MAG: GGDEF domain-containing protein [Anaerostipes sp.]|nr:GGDEF domain-containing protein [Anaerostipes sp.]